MKEIQVPAIQEGVLWMLSGGRATLVHTSSHPTLYLLQNILSANLRHHVSVEAVAAHVQDRDYDVAIVIGNLV
jgi:hypothetical protein